MLLETPEINSINAVATDVSGLSVADLLVDAKNEIYREVDIYAARIRTQISAAHEKHHLDKAVDAFIKVGKDLGVI